MITFKEILQEQNQKKVDLKHLLKWYSGKNLEKAIIAVDLLEHSIEQNYWIQKASRFVQSALGKPNVAQKIFKDAIGFKEHLYGQESLFGFQMAIMYGSFSYLENVNTEDIIKSSILKNKEKLIEFYNDFIYVDKEMKRLDATKPLPVFTSLGVSPTITKTLQDIGLKLDIKTVRVCPMKYEYVKQMIDGKEYTVPVFYLLWPKNTVFGTSRFKGSEQCQSCGHRIKNPQNWVPLIIDDEQGIPHALMVGADCANNIFGVNESTNFLIANK